MAAPIAVASKSGGANIGDLFGLLTLTKCDAFAFLRLLTNLDPDLADTARLKYDDHIDYFLPNLQLSCTDSGVQLGDVVAAGALYFSSAANSGNKDHGTSGTWEGDFVDGGIIALISGTNHVHDFDPSAAVAQSAAVRSSAALSASSA